MTASRLDIPAEAASITTALIARRDPAYEWGMRRTVPSEQPAHATRVPDIRKTASEWRRAHRDADPQDVLRLCNALWTTGYREERIVAITLAGGTKAMLQAVTWDHLAAWSNDIDNWEHVDHLAGVTGQLLLANPSLINRVHTFEASDNPWQRRLALVTLIVAFMKGAMFRDELTAMAERLKKDTHPLVRRAVVWARDRLKKDHLNAR
jgi:3-methyladenine DNA glycosylase AlkD